MSNMNKIDLDNFIFIGNKLRDRIYQIPEQDVKWFKETVELIRKYEKFYSLSNATVYNQCNNEKDGFCMFEKGYKERELYLDMLIEKILGIGNQLELEALQTKIKNQKARGETVVI